MITRLARWLSVFVLISLALMTASTTVTAQADSAATPEIASAATPRFGIMPMGDYPNGYIELELKPGATAELSINVVAVDSAPVTLRAYSTNALNMVNGGFAAGNEDDAPTGSTSWVSFPAGTFDLSGDATKEITFSVTVPEDAQPGQYISAIVAQTDQPIAISGLTTFDQILRSAISVAITVPGEQTSSFTLGSPEFNIETSAPNLVIPVTNTGNVLVKPAGQLTITTADGKAVATAPVEMGSIYGGYATTLEIALPEQLVPGDYIVSGTLADPASTFSVSIDKQTVTLQERVVVAPPQFTLDPVSVTAASDPIQFANVAMTINNDGSNIPTANVVLRVSKDGKPVEDYPLAQNQALPTGQTIINQRYIPATGWEAGNYTFEIVVSSVDSANGTEAVLASQSLDAAIAVP
jgi:hypothetical protein